MSLAKYLKPLFNGVVVAGLAAGAVAAVANPAHLQKTYPSLSATDAKDMESHYMGLTFILGGCAAGATIRQQREKEKFKPFTP